MRNRQRTFPCENKNDGYRSEEIATLPGGNREE